MQTCIIDLPGLCLSLIDRLEGDVAPGWFSELCAAGRTIIHPVLPAVTMTAQATYSTGKTPAEHGMIANGLPAWRLPEIHEHLDLSNYAEHRANVSFWEQSTKLVTAPRVWERQGRKTALLFVQSSMGGAASVVVTPKPEHTPDGKTVSMCWSDPPELYSYLRDQIGEFPLHHYWGPMAGMKSSEWISAAARLVWDREPTDLQWVYVPQLDYDLQRLGPDDPKCIESLMGVLGLLTPLVEKVKADGGRVLLISEYGMTSVHRSDAPNVHLSNAGLLQTTDTREVDYAASKAFAMCDHQVAHIYCGDETATERAAGLLSDMEVVDRVYRGSGRGEVGLDTPRAGDLVAFSHTDAWFEYRWWDDFAAAPDFAWTVDIHRKPGYDPLEMFANPKTRRIAADQPQLIKGSHGALPGDEADWPILLGCADAPRRIAATEVAELL